MNDKNISETIQVEQLCDNIKSILNGLDSDSGEKQSLTEFLILEVLIWGSLNGYEGLGILESAKFNWKELCDEHL